MKSLRSFTTARVSLGAAGDSLPTQPLLDLRLAHARAKDAVYWPLDANGLRRQLSDRGWPSVLMSSSARDRDEYLRRPDLGRTLHSESKPEWKLTGSSGSILFVIGDGLSALAVERHAVPVLEHVFRQLPHVPSEDNPVVIARQARVAVADEIGLAFQASLTVLLIGERPGLSCPDSLGVYLTWEPRLGRTDAERNCISNIHGAGLSYDLAAHKMVFLIHEMQRLRMSGVLLKDNSMVSLENSSSNRGLATP